MKYRFFPFMILVLLPPLFLSSQYNIPASYTVSHCILQQTPISNMPDIVEGIIPASLPVKLELLSPEVEAGKVLLRWKTYYEFQSRQFIIQRAISPSMNFENISYIPSQNQSTGSDYSYIDKPLAGGTYYYRLLQEDMDGEQNISKIISVTYKQNKLWHITDMGSNWHIQSSALIYYCLTDTQGIPIEKGSVNGSISLKKPFLEGAYFLKIVVNGNTVVQKLIR